MSADSQQYENKELVCLDKQHPASEDKKFVWTVGEQKFLQRLYDDGKVDALNQPKRCNGCRRMKKARYESSQRQGE